LSKPITSVTIMKLLDEAILPSLDDLVFGPAGNQGATDRGFRGLT
jgi:hypothetical protein